MQSTFYMIHVVFWMKHWQFHPSWQSLYFLNNCFCVFLDSILSISTNLRFHKNNFTYNFWKKCLIWYTALVEIGAAKICDTIFSFFTTKTFLGFCFCDSLGYLFEQHTFTFPISCHWSLSIPPENFEKISNFLMFSRAIERNQSYKMGSLVYYWNTIFRTLSNITKLMGEIGNSF